MFGDCDVDCYSSFSAVCTIAAQTSVGSRTYVIFIQTVFSCVRRKGKRVYTHTHPTHPLLPVCCVWLDSIGNRLLLYWCTTLVLVEKLQQLPSFLSSLSTGLFNWSCNMSLPNGAKKWDSVKREGTHTRYYSGGRALHWLVGWFSYSVTNFVIAIIAIRQQKWEKEYYTASLDEGKKGDTKNNERRKTLTHSVHVAHVPFSFAMFLPS